MPAMIICSICSALATAGPMVARILVRLNNLLIRDIIPHSGQMGRLMINLEYG